MKQAKKPNLIAAIVHISESEVHAIPGLVELERFNTDEEYFKNILWQLGADTSKPIELQADILHRNRLNKVVKCHRWMCQERLDDEWIESGYASQAAIDKVKGSKIVEDTYRMKMLTEDAQKALEERDARAPMVVQEDEEDSSEIV